MLMTSMLYIIDNLLIASATVGKIWPLGWMIFKMNNELEISSKCKCLSVSRVLDLVRDCDELMHNTTACNPWTANLWAICSLTLIAWWI